MSVKAVTFDCAQTLIAVDWKPALLAVESARAVGLSFDEVTCAERYDALLRKRWSTFVEINLTRDEALVDEFWLSLTGEWRAACDFPEETTHAIFDAAHDLLYGRKSTVFTLYEDVVPCLESLAAANVKMAVVSNWDISLHKTLRAFGLSQYFETVVASMEEGMEKPDPRIFEIALDRIGVQAEDCLHVGDNPLDDLAGARKAGIRGLVIDRQTPESSSVVMASLLELPGRIGI